MGNTRRHFIITESCRTSGTRSIFAHSGPRPCEKKILGQSQPEGSVAPMHKYLEADGIEKQPQLNGRKRAIQRWAGSRGNTTKKQREKPGKVLPARTKRLL